MTLTEEQLQSMERWAACDLREREGSEVQLLIDEVRRLRARPAPTVFKHVPPGHIEAQHFQQGYRAGVDSIFEAIGPIVRRVSEMEAGLRKRISVTQGALTKAIRTTTRPAGKPRKSARKRGRR